MQKIILIGLVWILTACGSVSDDLKTDVIGTVYVDGSSGDDNFSGSFLEPFKTIQAAINHAKAGEKVFVKAGIYHQRVVIKNSGTKNTPIIIEGEKDTNGKRLVTVHGGDLVTANWISSSIGKGVYETKDIPYATFAMTVLIDGILKDIPRLNYKKKEILGYDKDKVITTLYTKLDVKYWDALGALYAYEPSSKTTYIRFADGLNPNDLQLYSSSGSYNHYGLENVQKLPITEGATFEIANKSYITIKGFKIDGAQNGVLIHGKDAMHNLIEDNEIVNGQRRVFIGEYAHHNQIKNNKMHMELLSSYRPAAWYDGKSYEQGVSELYYDIYKHEVGNGTFSPLDDCGVFIDGAGEENEIYENEIYDTLGGIAGAQVGKIYIHDNYLHHISSIATGLVSQNIHETYIYKNRMHDVNIGFRIQLMRNDRLAKKAWFFENIIHNPTEVGSNIFFWRPNDTPKPKEGTTLPKIFFYHNTFVGAGNDYNSLRDVGDDVVFVNNIFNDMKLTISSGKIGYIDYNWFNMQRDYEGGNNIVDMNQKIWNPNSKISNFNLPTNSDARDAGIDVSKPFTIGGKSFQALPYMKNGYFKGNKPNIGAVQ